GGGGSCVLGCCLVYGWFREGEGKSGKTETASRYVHGFPLFDRGVTAESAAYFVADPREFCPMVLCYSRESWP
ncbi:MAG: hypothetical protein FWD57_16390, partial [Polyangiaceae bacterium]|nr:hypothetical protein [Polyangiaceae bacterium]